MEKRFKRKKKNKYSLFLTLFLIVSLVLGAGAISSNAGSVSNVDENQKSGDTTVLEEIERENGSDKVKPEVIFSFKVSSIQQGDEIDLLSFVSAMDESGKNLNVELKDDGGFNTNKPGTYKIKYKAEHLVAGTMEREHLLEVIPSPSETPKQKNIKTQAAEVDFDGVVPNDNVIRFTKNNGIQLFHTLDDISKEPVSILDYEKGKTLKGKNYHIVIDSGVNVQMEKISSTGDLYFHGKGNVVINGTTKDIPLNVTQKLSVDDTTLNITALDGSNAVRANSIQINDGKIDGKTTHTNCIHSTGDIVVSKGILNAHSTATKSVYGIYASKDITVDNNGKINSEVERESGTQFAYAVFAKNLNVESGSTINGTGKNIAHGVYADNNINMNQGTIIGEGLIAVATRDGNITMSHNSYIEGNVKTGPDPNNTPQSEYRGVYLGSYASGQDKGSLYMDDSKIKTSMDDPRGPGHFGQGVFFNNNNKNLKMKDSEISISEKGKRPVYGIRISDGKIDLENSKIVANANITAVYFDGPTTGLAAGGVHLNLKNSEVYGYGKVPVEGSQPGYKLPVASYGVDIGKNGSKTYDNTITIDKDSKLVGEAGFDGTPFGTTFHAGVRYQLATMDVKGSISGKAEGVGSIYGIWASGTDGHIDGGTMIGDAKGADKTVTSSFGVNYQTSTFAPDKKQVNLSNGGKITGYGGKYGVYGSQELHASGKGTKVFGKTSEDGAYGVGFSSIDTEKNANIHGEGGNNDKGYGVISFNDINASDSEVTGTSGSIGIYALDFTGKNSLINADGKNIGSIIDNGVNLDNTQFYSNGAKEESDYSHAKGAQIEGNLNLSNKSKFVAKALKSQKGFDGIQISGGSISIDDSHLDAWTMDYDNTEDPVYAAINLINIKDFSVTNKGIAEEHYKTTFSIADTPIDPAKKDVAMGNLGDYKWNVGKPGSVEFSDDKIGLVATNNSNKLVEFDALRMGSDPVTGTQPVNLKSADSAHKINYAGATTVYKTKSGDVETVTTDPPKPDNPGPSSDKGTTNNIINKIKKVVTNIYRTVINDNTTVSNDYNDKEGSIDSIGKPERVKENIEPTEQPLSAGYKPSGLKDGWSLLSLILSITAFIISMILLITALAKRGDEEDSDNFDKDSSVYGQSDQDNKGQEPKKRRRLWLRLTTMATGLLTGIVFLFLNDMTLPMVWSNKWTPLIAFIFIVHIVALLVFTGLKKKINDDEEKPAY